MAKLNIKITLIIACMSLTQSSYSNKGPIDLTLEERDLLTITPKAKDILGEYAAYHSITKDTQQLNLTTLAYLTPWNLNGYKMAELFANKFTHIVPVWLQLKINHDDRETLYFQGQHHWLLENEGKELMQNVRHKNPSIKIVPRVILDDWYPSELQEFLFNPKFAGRTGKMLADLAAEHNFDGFTLELWSFFSTQQKPEIAQAIIRIAAHFRKNKLDLILVIPPPIYYGNRLGIFLKEDLDRLAPYVTAFSVMTYDYSNAYRPGPSSPLHWVKDCIEALVPKVDSPLRKKLLVGMNLFGMNFTPTGGSAILGNDFLEILAKQKPKILWNEEDAEHYVEYKTHLGKNLAFYPTLMFIKKRLNLIQTMNVGGVALWEIGQGLDYFYELF